MLKLVLSPEALLNKSKIAATAKMSSLVGLTNNVASSAYRLALKEISLLLNGDKMPSLVAISSNFYRGSMARMKTWVTTDLPILDY